MNNRVFVIGEVGINANGDIDIAKKIIDGVVSAGADAVKFQKRTIDIVYTKEELAKPRESPWGTTNGDLKYKLEFGEKEYDEINRYCKDKGIHWFASAWDIPSLKFLNKYDCQYNKVASAMITYIDFIDEVAKAKKYTFISTGMSTMEEIATVINVFNKYDCPFELMHCNSTYPMKDKDANLRVISTLREKFNCKVGYSGHEVGIILSCAAASLGATSIERHITLQRESFGSDQSASMELDGFCKLVKYIRAIESALGDGIKVITEDEKKISEKLRWFSHD